MDEMNMKAVLRQTGLTADRLRVWERRYGAVQPARAPNGRRIYRKSEIERLKLLATLVAQGHAIGKIARLSDEELLRRVGSSADARTDLGNELKELIENLAHFDLEKIRTRLGLLRFSLSPREFAFQIVPQVMMLVGKKIETGNFSIAQEHALSEIFQGHLKSIYEDLSALDGTGTLDGTFLFCTRDGDPHDFGLLMAAIAARAAGLRTHYVGKSLPIEALADAALKLKPHAIVIGMAALPKAEEKISPAEYFRSMDSHLDPEIEIWVGGSAAGKIDRAKTKRTLFIFESIKDLEEKLKLVSSKRGT